MVFCVKMINATFGQDLLLQQYIDEYGGKRRAIVHQIDVSSRQRDRTAKYQFDNSNSFYLDEKSMRFESNSKILRLFLQHNHTIKVNDRIYLSNVREQIVNVTSYGIVKKDIFVANNEPYGVTDTIDCIFEFENGSPYLKIKHSHYLTVLSPSQAFVLREYDKSDLYVEISNFPSNQPNNTHYDMIPINDINRKHKLLIETQTNTTILPNVFYVKLSTTYTQPFIVPTNKFQLKLQFYYYGGIPLRLLNISDTWNKDNEKSNYYVTCATANNLLTYHKVVNVSFDFIDIELRKKSCGASTFEGKFSPTLKVGNNGMECNRIIDVQPGYPCSNRYNVKIDRTINNIIAARLSSSEFINIERNLIGSGYKQNNCFYWSNLIDSNYVYKIEILDGLYSADQLKTAIEYAVENTKRYQYDLTNKSYVNKNIIKININFDTNVYEFQAYNEFILQKPIELIDPPILPMTPTTTNSYTATMYCTNHNAQIGMFVIINNAIEHMGLLINGVFEIINIVDENRFQILIKYVNISNERIDTKGGDAVIILIPIQFRLDFTLNNSMKLLFGFFSEDIVTKYDYKITNSNYSETPTNNQIYDRLRYSPMNKFLYIRIKQFELNDTTNSSKYFAKILLPFSNNNNKQFGELLCNTFVLNNVWFQDKINNLSELDIELFDENGKLYDTQGSEHSFTIELITLTNTTNRLNCDSQIPEINNTHQPRHPRRIKDA